MLIATKMNILLSECWMTLVKPDCYINAFYSYHKRITKRISMESQLKSYQAEIVFVRNSTKIIIEDKVFDIIYNKYTNEMILHHAGLYYHFDVSGRENEFLIPYIEYSTISQECDEH